MAKYEYDSGLPFDDELRKNLEDQFKQRIDNNFPSLLIIDGGQGEGKTTLMIQIIDYINKLKGFPPCTLSITDHPQVALGGSEFAKFFNVCKIRGLPVIGYDEAGDFSKRASLTRFNAMINRRFETFRSSNIMVILCLPNFNVLDNHLFDLKVPRGLLHLRNREETINYGNYFGYSLYAMNWIKYWFNKLPTAIRYDCYNKTTFNFRGHFKNLLPEREKKLAELSNYGKDKESIMAEIRMEGYLTVDEIAKKLYRSIIWVRLTMKKLRIKEKRIYKKKKFYNQTDFDRIMDYMEEKNRR